MVRLIPFRDARIRDWIMVTVILGDCMACFIMSLILGLTSRSLIMSLSAIVMVVVSVAWKPWIWLQIFEDIGW